MTDRPRKARAFTLIELLVTAAICSIIMGIGVGAYIGINRDLAWHSAVSSVTSLLHAARNAATETRTPVSVIFKTETDPVPEYSEPDHERYICTQAYATLLKRAGVWHFEETGTAFDPDAPIVSGAFHQEASRPDDETPELVPGKYGKGLKFLRWDEEGTEIPEPQALIIGKKLEDGAYRKLSTYDLREGLHISAWVRPELPPEPEDDSYYYYPVIAKPLQEDAQRANVDEQPVYSMSLLLDTAADPRVFKLWAAVRIDDGPLIVVETHPIVRPDTWTQLAMIYSGADTAAASNFVRVFINGEELTGDHGIKRFWEDGTEIFPPDEPSSVTGKIETSDHNAIVGGDGIDYFHGVIDEVLIDGVTTSERSAPPATVLFRFWNCGTDQPETHRIDFDRAGRLIVGPDGLPVVALYSAGSKTATLVGVELTGAIKTWTADARQGETEAEAQEWLDD